MATSSIASLKYRTAFHFQPTMNWMNDPNGPMYYNGYYHFFYQYNPNGAIWTPNLSWAHSVSSDLVNWSIVKDALFCTEDHPFDINGCWSGSTTILPNDHRPVILYTGLDKDKRQGQNIAFCKNVADPKLEEWVKPDYNPIIDLPSGIQPDCFRDPSTGWIGEDGCWRIGVGSVEEDHTGVIFLYKSKDFVQWNKTEKPLFSMDNTGILECPDFFPVSKDGSKEGLDTSSFNGDSVNDYLLKVSIFELNIDVYTIGKWVNDAYFPDIDHKGSLGVQIDFGKFYASKSFFDPTTKRRILWAWVNEECSSIDNIAKGWAGIQIVPRLIWIDETGHKLMQWPIEEFESLRRNEISFQHLDIMSQTPFEIKGLITTSQADVEVEFDIPNLEDAEEYDPSWSMDPQKICTLRNASVSGGVGPFGLLVLASDNLKEYTAVFFRIFKAKDKYLTLMCSDQSKSSLRNEVSKNVYGGFVDIDISNTPKISLRTLIDHSVVESFGAGGRTCITSRVYPTSILTDNIHLYVFNNGTNSVRVADFKAWEMAKARID